MEAPRKTAPVLGHTGFSWAHHYEAVPLGHTKFSWSSGIAPVEAPREKSPQLAEKQEPKNDQTPQKKRKGPAPPKAVTPPLKVLCLHGYMQSGPIWEKKTSSFRRCFNKYNMSFVCPTGPHKLDQAAEDGSDIFKWMDTVPAFDGSKAFLSCHKYKGMKHTIKFLKKFIEDNGPFDGIIGYSQGGIVASLLLAMCNPPVDGSAEKKKTRSQQFHFRFGMIIAGFPAPALDFKAVYSRLQKQRTDQAEGVVDVPTLHIWGVKDDLVPPENSRQLPELFTNAEVYEHPGGHVAPNISEARKAYHAFLDRALAS